MSITAGFGIEKEARRLIDRYPVVESGQTLQSQRKLWCNAATTARPSFSVASIID